MSDRTMPSLDGRTFVPEAVSAAGEVDESTRFDYHESDDGTVFAHYQGGSVRLGFLVGTRQGDQLEFRYAQVANGESATGYCRTRITQLGDGRLRLNEAWSWESRPGTGTSILVEDPAADGATPCSFGHPVHIHD